MRMRCWVVLMAALAALGPACRKTRPIEVQTPDAQFIPRDIAVRTLRDLLPTAELVTCSLPKDSLKPSEISEWKIGANGFELVRVKGEPIVLKYTEVTRTEMAQSGSTFIVRLFTVQQKSETADHFRFQWRQEETPKRVIELFESLRR
jgi:hypothetical protein